MKNSSDKNQAVLQTITKRTKIAIASANRAANVIFVSGLFNILHPGHLRLLRFAAECGDFLVVGVLADTSTEGITMLDDKTRLEFVQAIDWVDYAFLLDSDVGEFVTALKPAKVVKGKEHEGTENAEQAAVESYGGKIIFSSGETSFSSTELLRPTLSLKSAIDKSSAYLERHAITLEDMRTILGKFDQQKVAVIGDTIVDEYVQCDPLGLSQEDPTVVVTPIDHKCFMGGAAIVAGHLKGLGAKQVHYFSVLGMDNNANFVRQCCEEYAINYHFQIDDSRPTTLKQRYRARTKTLLRVNHVRQHQIALQIQDRLFEDIVEFLSDCDLLIFADFNYGVLPQNLVDRIILYCKEHKIMMVADSQCSSQVGDVSRFTDMSLMAPTEHEARTSLRNNEDGLVVLAENLRTKARPEHVVITLAEEGLLIHAKEPGKRFQTDRLPAFNQNPSDCAGAGDSFLATAALAMTAGANIWISAYLGNISAACQVARVGNLPLTQQELLNEIS